MTEIIQYNTIQYSSSQDTTFLSTKVVKAILTCCWYWLQSSEIKIKIKANSEVQQCLDYFQYYFKESKVRAKAKALDKAASDYQTMPSIFCGLSHVSIEYKYKYMYM